MKLLLILIFYLIHLSQGDYKCHILGKLSKNNKITTTRNNCCVYLDTNEFPNVTEIAIEATIHDGSYQDNKLFYEIMDYEPTLDSSYTLDLYTTSKYNSLVSYSTKNGYHYDYKTSHYKIQKVENRYLLVAFPLFDAKNSEIEISEDEGFPLWAIITIPIVGSLIIATIIIIVCCCIKKAKRKNFISPFPVHDDSLAINSSDNEPVNYPNSNNNNYPQ